jgi:hypothetical protein
VTLSNLLNMLWTVEPTSPMPVGSDIETNFVAITTRSDTGPECLVRIARPHTTQT